MVHWFVKNTIFHAADQWKYLFLVFFVPPPFIPRAGKEGKSGKKGKSSKSGDGDDKGKAGGSKAVDILDAAAMENAHNICHNVQASEGGGGENEGKVCPKQ